MGLKVCLRGEALKKQLIVQDYFNVFFDLKKEFNKCFFSPSKKPTLQKMLQMTGQEFVGRAHSGVDDCMNIARVVQALLREDHVFTDPEHIDREYDPSRDPTLVDFNLMRPRSLSSCVLRMRGLPYSATVDDVRTFFEPLIPADIVLVSTTDGRPSGTGYARFASVEDTQCALQKDRQYIGTRYIELFAASSAEWESARVGCH